MGRERSSTQQKRLVAERANHRCEYCQSPDAYSPQTFSIEHIIPVSKGGVTALENLAFACQGCNNHKYTKVVGIDLITNQSVSLYNPRLDAWVEHFVWHDDGLELIGISATGRATIATLHLNRQRLINLRRLLLLAGMPHIQ